MAKPTPVPTDPADLKDLALAVLRNDRFPSLASMDGDQARVRPVSPVRTDGFTVYIANLRGYHKTQEIAENPKVELCYLDKNHHQVRITGVAHLEQDRNLLQQISRRVKAENPKIGNDDGRAHQRPGAVERIDKSRFGAVRVAQL